MEVTPHPMEEGGGETEIFDAALHLPVEDKFENIFGVRECTVRRQENIDVGRVNLSCLWAEILHQALQRSRFDYLDINSPPLKVRPLIVLIILQGQGQCKGQGQGKGQVIFTSLYCSLQLCYDIQWNVWFKTAHRTTESHLIYDRWSFIRGMNV